MTPNEKFIRYSGKAFYGSGPTVSIQDKSLGVINIWFDPDSCKSVLWREDADQLTLTFSNDLFLCVPRLEFLRQIYPYRGFSFLESVGQPAPKTKEPVRDIYCFSNVEDFLEGLPGSRLAEK